MSAFVLKIIAIITMTIDHLGYLIFSRVSFFNYIGRLAFPIFAFQISQGYTYTKNLKKYLTRLFIFAFISQIPYMLFYSVATNNPIPFSEISNTLYTAITTLDFRLNIFFTLVIGLLAIIAFDKIKYKPIGLLIAVGLAFLAHYIKADYGIYGVSIILLFYMFRNNNLAMAISFIVATTIKYLIRIYPAYDFYTQGLDVSKFVNREISLCLYTILPIIFICLYNGKKGRNTKQLLYYFYPIHLLLIYGISLLVR